MRALAILFLLSAHLWADNASSKVDLIAGEKFADQYFRPPPTTFKGVAVLYDVIGSAPEMRTGSALFKAGAWYQLYVQSTATLNSITSIVDQDSIFKIELEQLWHIAAAEVKDAGITPDQLASLTSDPDAKKLADDPDPETWKQAQADTGPQSVGDQADNATAPTPPTDMPSPQDQAATDAKKQEAPQHSVYIVGLLSEKTGDGLLVACPPGFMVVPGRETVTIDRQIPGKPPPVYGMCFLKNYPSSDQLVDGDKVEITAYPSDPYSYQAVDGSTKTIPCYDAAP